VDVAKERLLVCVKRRFIALTLALMMMVVMTPTQNVRASGNLIDDPPPIDYSSPDLSLTGVTFSFKSGKSVPADATPNDNAKINLTEETLTTEGFNIEAYSTDGGVTWKAGSLSDKDFAKLLNKGFELWLCYKDYNKNAGKPQGSGDEHNIIAFAKVNKRPDAPKLTVNYEIAADKTGETPGQWVLTTKGGTTAVKSNIEIALASGKKPDENGFGIFPETGGIQVKELTGTKPEKTVYYYRTAPTQSGGAYTAASRAKKITVTSELKAPKYKIKEKAEKLNKDGSVKSSATAVIKANTYTRMDGKVTFYGEKATIDVMKVFGTIEFWQSATALKAASAKQIITREGKINEPEVGDIIEFGSYDWRVLAVENGKALVISEYLIERRAYHNTVENITWADCDLRKYLNGDFYNSFSATERARIADTNNVNSDNQWYGTAGGANTTDKIFLLSLEEVVRYFGDSGRLANRPSGNPTYIRDQYDNNRVAYELSDKSSAYYWWLRSPGYYSDNAACVIVDGWVGVLGYFVYHDYIGVRPALWLKL
jgi:hypothetical protein